MRPSLAALLAALLAAAPAAPAVAAAPATPSPKPATGGPSLLSMLEEGPVVVVKHNARGRFAACTGVVEVHRPAKAIWEVVSQPGTWHTFMPKMVRSDVLHQGKDWAMVTFEIEVPGPNPVYTMRFDMDRAARTVTLTWMRGDLKGSHSTWKIVPVTATTSLLYYTNDTENYSGLAESLEDKQQTITIGVNVTAVLAGLEAVRTRVEASK